MDLPLVAAFKIDWSYWGYLAQGIIALGCVIFIHEFGHFAAAKLCGVKVEKFYLGFDMFGMRLFRFRWGETEYGIGAFPFGGYVSMYGQTDNPGKQAEEAERAKALAAGGKPVDPEAAAVWDPRSYPAQTVPERMFIISAGVIMNTITAFLFATIAYLMGVQYTPTTVISVVPGGPAWEQDIRPGDVITQVDDVKQPRFEADLRTRAVLSDLEKGLKFHIQRSGQADFDLQIHPRKPRVDSVPALGIAAGPTLPKLNTPKDTAKYPPTREGTPARLATPAFVGGDEFLKIGDREVKTDLDIITAFIEDADKKVPVTVRRTTVDAGTVKTQELVIDVEPRPARTLGLTMEFGPVVSVQNDSPAMKAGIHVGDHLKSIDGEPIGDPITASERFRRKQKAAPEKPWNVVVERMVDGKPTDVVLEVTPRAADRFEAPSLFACLSIPTIGVAYTVPAKIAAIDPNGPAAASGLKVGDTVSQFKSLPTEEPTETGETPKSRTAPLTDNNAGNWPIYALQLNDLRRSTKVELKTTDGKTATIEPADSKEFFNSDRGFDFERIRANRKAEGLSQAFDYAYVDTRDSMTQVYRFLHAMWIGQIPTENVGGIITIADQAGQSASGGFATLLLFLMMLSCNLAVLNFLPFPMLDGGHMVFLTYEAIFRRPPPERFVGYLNIAGFACLMFLMGYALKNDIVRLLGF